MPLKKGAGDQLQPYDGKTGEYCEKNSPEKDKENLVLAKLFGLNLDIKVPYPQYEIHDDEYAELFIKYCINTEKCVISPIKFTNYLLVPNNNRDKSKLFNIMGYNISNYNQLIQQITDNTDFSKRIRVKFNAYGVSFSSPTKIFNQNTGKYKNFLTVWFVERDGSIKFVTIKPGECE